MQIKPIVTVKTCQRVDGKLMCQRNPLNEDGTAIANSPLPDGRQVLTFLTIRKIIPAEA